MEAKPIDAIRVLSFYQMPDSVHVAEVPCQGYDVFKQLPKAIEIKGLTLGLTGWNSDRFIAYYRDDSVVGRYG